MATALNLTGYAKHFDKPWKGDSAGWGNLALQLAFTAGNVYGTVTDCTSQYKEWNDDTESDYRWPYEFDILQDFAIDGEPEV